MRVVCLVPSWTETLLHAGVEVVGRSRYCVHPRDTVRSIPVVGGTRDVEWSKVAAVNADLLVLDRAENTCEMAEQSTIPWVATCVTSVDDVERELGVLHGRVGPSGLPSIAERWGRVRVRLARESSRPDLAELPGVIEWVQRPRDPVDRFLYLIWKDPWKAVGNGTFIGSMFDLLGFGPRMIRPGAKYPDIRLEDLDPERTLLLFSSEPYPFHEQTDFIAKLPFSSAIVDGERFGWFGWRALRFLEGLAGRENGEGVRVNS